MTILRVIDFETSGQEPPAVVVEYGYCDLTLAEGVWTVGLPKSRLYYVEKMPPEVRAIHHITTQDVAAAYPFDPAEVHNPEENVFALVAHNWDFEAKFLGAVALPAICTYKAALRAWPDAPGHSNGALRYWLEDEGRLSLDHDTAMPPHRAGPDAYVTAHILKALLADVTGREMVAWTKEPRVLPTCPIGEWRGKKWADVDLGFLGWMVRKPVEADLVWNAQRELERRSSRP